MEQRATITLPDDHQYAINKDREEARLLRQLMSVHLDLIQQQMATIAAKDKQIAALQLDLEAARAPRPAPAPPLAPPPPVPAPMPPLARLSGPPPPSFHTPTPPRLAVEANIRSHVLSIKSEPTLQVNNSGNRTVYSYRKNGGRNVKSSCLKEVTPLVAKPVPPKPADNKCPTSVFNVVRLPVSEPPKVALAQDPAKSATKLPVTYKQEKPNVVQQKSPPPPKPARKFFTSSLRDKMNIYEFSFGERNSGILEYLEATGPASPKIDSIISLPSASPSAASTAFSAHNDIVRITPAPPRPTMDAMDSDSDDKSVIIIEPPDAARNNDTRNKAAYTITKEPVEPAKNFTTNNTKGHCSSGNMLEELDISMPSTSGAKIEHHNMLKNVLTMKKTKPGSASTQPKTFAAKKRTRQRAPTSGFASKALQADQPSPYSWCFSGQDFKMMTEDINPLYHIAKFVENNSVSSSGADEKPEQWSNETPNLEVPRWREIEYSPDPTIVTMESVDREMVLKRHLKMEAEEKRRKRWDSQRIREQRHIERLKRNEERRSSSGNKMGKNSGVSTTEELPQSLHPTLDDIFNLEITDRLPVSGFGECIPNLRERYFSLPWRHNRNRHSSSDERGPSQRRKRTFDEE